jgi:hypothetical protein
MTHLSDKPIPLLEAITYETANKSILFWFLPSSWQTALLIRGARRKHRRYLKLRKLFKEMEND